jgi:hypothetical protein
MKQSRACCDIESVIRIRVFTRGWSRPNDDLHCGMDLNRCAYALAADRCTSSPSDRSLDRWIVVPRLPNKCAARR